MTGSHPRQSSRAGSLALGIEARITQLKLDLTEARTENERLYFQRDKARADAQMWKEVANEYLAELQRLRDELRDHPHPSSAADRGED